jgi:hypothetical protein
MHYRAGRGFALRIIGACVLALTLAACSWDKRPDCVFGIADGSDCAPGTTPYNQAQTQQQQARTQAISDDAQCQSYGAAPGSQSYIQCRMNLDNQRAQMRAAVASQLVGRMVAPPAAPPSTVNVNLCNVPGQVNTCMYPR